MTTNPSGAVHPTVFLFLWVAATIGLQYLWPLDIISHAFLELPGRIMMVVAGLLIVWAQYTFRKHNTSTDHNKPTSALITNGPFQFSRNPIYVGLLLVVSGVAMTYNNGWGLIMVIPFVIALLYFTIHPEEAYLERTFGPDYTRYRKHVRRWL